MSVLHIANLTPACCQLYFLWIFKLIALSKYFKQEDGNASWYTCTVFVVMLWSATTKFEFCQHFLMLGFGPNCCLKTNISGYTVCIQGGCGPSHTWPPVPYLLHTVISSSLFYPADIWISPPFLCKLLRDYTSVVRTVFTVNNGSFY